MDMIIYRKNIEETPNQKYGDHKFSEFYEKFTHTRILENHYIIIIQ